MNECPYTQRGEILGAEIGTIREGDVYSIRIEATPLIMRLVMGANICALYIMPSEDHGRAWFQIPYTSEIDFLILELIDTLADIRFIKPDFGQLALEDAGGGDG